MPAIAESKVIKAAIQGVEKAQNAYKDWSGGYWLWQAPEYLTTVSVAHEISKLAGAKYLTLENGVRSAILEAGAKGRGKLHSHIRENGRMDMLLWRGNGTPRAPIEVKVQVTNATKILKDVHRIEKTLHRKKADSSFSFGMIVYYISTLDSKSGQVSAKDKLVSKTKRIYENVNAEISESCRLTQHISEIHEDGDSAWAAVVLHFKLQKDLVTG